MSDLMLDVETLGTSPGCAIVSIGAVLFDREGEGWPQDPCHEFYARIRLDTCERVGLRFEAATIEWWMERADKWPGDKLHTSLQSALMTLAFFVERANPPVQRIWAHGASFDPPILAAAYRAVGEAIPWGPTLIRDTRTLFEMVGMPVSLADPAHHALEDARAQARAVQKAMKRWRGR